MCYIDGNRSFKNHKMLRAQMWSAHCSPEWDVSTVVDPPTTPVIVAR